MLKSGYIYKLSDYYYFILGEEKYLDDTLIVATVCLPLTETNLKGKDPKLILDNMIFYTNRIARFSIYNEKEFKLVKSSDQIDGYKATLIRLLSSITLPKNITLNSDNNKESIQSLLYQIKTEKTHIEKIQDRINRLENLVIDNLKEEEPHKTIIISTFPCCGKSYAFENYQDQFSILDSDSSKFSWIYRNRTPEEVEKLLNELYHNYSDPDDIIKEHVTNELIKVRNLEFPTNYITHIKENIGKVDFIFVSSYLTVRQALTDAGIDFITVYPEARLLNEWIGRMYRRGNDKSFIDFQIKNWDSFVNNIDNEPHGSMLIRLEEDEYIDDKLLIKIKEEMN